MRRSGVLGLALGVIALSGAGCARNPVTGRPEIVVVSAKKEREIGEAEAKKVEQLMGFRGHATLDAYLQAIGRRLAEHSPRQDVDYAFAIVDMPEPNAFALPGGFIYVSRGLLALINTEDELAAVLGHEVAHVAARHHVRGATASLPFLVLGIPAAFVGMVSSTLGDVVAAPSRLAGGLVLAKHSRGQERAADRIGMEIAAAAGWDPGALASFLRTLEREDQLRRGGPRDADFFDSHPSTPERAEKAAKLALDLKRGPGRSIAADRAALLARLEGLLVGENPAVGVFLGARFLHPELDFTLRFPPEWETDNQPQAVLALPTERGGKVFVLLQVSAEGSDPVEGARSDGLDERQLGELERLQINGLPAARLVARRRRSAADLTWIAHRGSVYRIAGASPTSEFPRYQEAFLAVARSFRPLGPKDRAEIRESLLRTERARGGERLAQLVRRTSSVWDAEETAVANALERADTRLDQGQLLKVPIAQRYRGRGS